MKSILIINYEYPPIGGGASNACYYIALNFAKKGILTSVLTSAYKSNIGVNNENGVLVYRVPAFRKKVDRSSLLQMTTFVISALFKLPSVIKLAKCDSALIFFSFPCGPLGLILKFVYKIPFVVSLRGADVPGFERQVQFIHKILLPLRRSIYVSSKAIVANSEGLKDLALQTDPGYKIEVIQNGIDTSLFSPSLEKDQNTKCYTFLFAGRFCAQKNIAILIESFKICRSRNVDTKLILAGDGPDTGKLKRIANNLGIDQIIKWTGWCSKKELLSFFRLSNCFVNPSICEGMSNAVLEAMSCGLPVIAGDCIGNSDIVKEKINGLLYDCTSPYGLADKMIMLTENRNLSKQLGVNGRDICKKYYSWEASADRYLNLF
jgi:glycosyltransferase involved in cell wall biosynthesis